MASKRFPRGFRQFDNGSRLDSPTARGNAFGQPRVTLVVAAVIVFAAGALIGTRFGGQAKEYSLTTEDRFPSTHPDKNLFPGTHAQISDLSADLLTDPVAEGNTRQADTAPTTKADKAATRPGAKPQSAQQQSESAQQQSRSAQQQQLQETEEEPAAAQASSSQLHDSNWRNALREQLSAASGYLSSGLHSVPKDATAISIGPDQVASGSQSAAAGNPAIDATQTSKGGKHRNKKGSQTEAVPIVPNFAASNFPWDIKMVDKTICNDSCHKARDGKCDDGSTLEEDQVFCDLGTDCHDCGNWTIRVPQEKTKEGFPPIKFLHKRQIDVFVKNTTTVPSFQMAYADPAKDVDVSAQMEYGAVVEIGLTQMWYLALRDKCVQPGGKRALVLDVGANFGWYSIYAAMLGCRVIAWEPVPHFRAFLTYNRYLNHLEDLIEIRDTAVVEVGGLMYNLTVPQRGIWGTAGIGGLNIDRGIDNQGEYETVQAVGERVDEVVHEDVLLLKVDVEGLEPAVMKSCSGLLDKHKVAHIVMEYSPGPWEIHSKWDEYSDLAQMLINLLDRSYTILHVHDGLARSSLLQLPDWAGDMGLFEEVRKEHMLYDMADARLLQLKEMGCPKPQELSQFSKQWMSCNSIPEDLNPKSFRAAFGHNTNIWLMQGKQTFKVGSPVGVMGLDQDMTEWYGQRPLQLGMGYRPCELLDPSIQVRHRCTCTSATVCGAEAALVESLAQQGSMPPFDN